jgi:tetratricopeptide (TPR) repeat protein
LAMVYAEKPDKLDEALKLALKAKELAPQNPVSLDVLGWVYVQKGDIKKGLEKLNAASKKLPNDPVIQYHLGVAHYKNNDVKAAQKALQAAVRISKNFKGAEHAQELLNKISQ